MSPRFSKRLEDVGAIIVTTVSVSFFFLPALNLFITSFKEPKSIWSLLHFGLTVDNYQTIMAKQEFLNSLVNSSIASILATALSLLLSTLAAYSISRFRYNRRNDVAFFILTLYMFPPIVSLIPLWNMASNLALLDNLGFLALCYTYFNLPFLVWLLRGFFVGIPEEIEEAALIDGCSRVTAFRKVTLPLMGPGVAVATIFAFILSWNEFMFASTLTSYRATTFPVIIQSFMSGQFVNWSAVSAGGTLAVIPVLILSLVIQKHIVAGLTLGAVKG